MVDRKNRTSCKACRLRKCLLVGMSKSGCRYGRRSNWFKIHCLMQRNVGTGSGGKVPSSGGGSAAASAAASAPYPPPHAYFSTGQHNSLQGKSPRLSHNNNNITDSPAAIFGSQSAAAAFFNLPQLNVGGGLVKSRSPSPLNNSAESLSVHSSPSPSSSSVGMLSAAAALEPPVSPPTFSLAPSMLCEGPPTLPPPILDPAGLAGLARFKLSPPPPPSLADQHASTAAAASGLLMSPSLMDQSSLYKLSPLLAVHPLLLAANPLFKLDFSAQLELLKQRRAMFEALSQKTETDDSISVEEDSSSAESAAALVVGVTPPTADSPQQPTPAPTSAETPIDLSVK